MRARVITVLSGLLVTVASAASATSSTAEKYAWQWPLTLARADSGIHQIELTPVVYESITDPQLGDLAVLDAQGHAVPASLQAPADVQAGAPRSVSLPWYPAPATASPTTPPRWRIRAESAAGQGVQRIETEVLDTPAASTTAADILIDARAAGARIQSLELAWPAATDAIDARYRLDGSDDLNQWTPLREGRLLDLDNQGHRIRNQRIDLDGIPGHAYYRVRPLDTGRWPVVDAVQATLVAEQTRALAQWRELTGTAAPAGSGSLVEFENPGRFPISLVDIQVAANSTSDWSLESRDRSDVPWLRRLPTRVYYQLTDAGERSQSVPVDLGSAYRDRHWRLVSSTQVRQLPTLHLGYRPETLVFLAQGEAPFTLVAGSASARRAQAPVADVLAGQRARHGAEWTPPLATPGERAVRDGEAALQATDAEVERDWRTWLLWAVLILGAALVAGLALSLLRRASTP